MTTFIEKRRDLTRWNRGGLERFQYIDGDAANWLEELRLAHFSQFLRGIENEPRTPEYWRDIFMRPGTDWPLAAERALLKDALAWQDLWQDFPDEPDTVRKRNDRLLERYNQGKGDQTFEISRAFARAVHVLLGYADAYANEGYIGTATQWDNLKKLATMIGYYPAPAASATTMVGLTTKEEVRFETVSRGLGMKHSPSEGGPPIIFETLEDLVVHEALNEIRAQDWDKNPDPRKLDQRLTWLADGYKEELSVGDIVLAQDLAAPENPKATLLSEVTVNENPEGKPESFSLKFENAVTLNPTAANARLLVGYPKPRRGLLQVAPSTTRMVVAVSNPAPFLEGNIIALKEVSSNTIKNAIIEKIAGSRLLLKGTGLPATSQKIQISPLAEYAITNDNDNLFPEDVDNLLYIGGNGNVSTKNGSKQPANSPQPNFNKFDFTNNPVKKAFAPGGPDDLNFKGARVLQSPADSIEFDGSPPEGMASGSWLVASPDDGTGLYPLKAESLSESDKTFTVEFSNGASLANLDPSEVLFYGPFSKALKLKDYDQNSEPAIAQNGVVFLEIRDPRVASLLKTNRQILVENLETGKVVVASLIEPSKEEPDGSGLFKTILAENQDLWTGLPKCQTVFRGNALKAGHGETKPRKTLGSGNGEKPAQTFHLDEPEISFVPDPTSETGVRPDIDIEVAGEIWTWVGSILEAEKGLKTYTTTTREDGTLDIRFLTRLSTGNNNVVVARYRVGSGLSGNKVPAGSFSKPLKSSAYVKEIHQPLAPSGGAGREAASAIKTNAPGHLRALGRAVSCIDFATLGTRHSSVLKARFDKKFVTGKGVQVIVTILPADGQVASDTLMEDVRNFIQTRAVPGVTVSVESFVPVPVPCHATLLVDKNAFDIDLVRENAEKALLDNLSIVNRELGQSLYLGDVLAVLESVAGVEAVRNAGFGADPGHEARTYFPDSAPFRTIHAKPEQVLHLERPGDIVLKAEAFT